MSFFLPAVPLITGFLLDCIIGDPYNMPHPVRLIGKLISMLEKLIRDRQKNLYIGGAVMTVIVMTLSSMCPILLLLLCYRINMLLGIAAESILCFYMLAARCLYNETMKVYHAIENDDTESARKAVSMIVGRDTKKLDRKGIIRAAVETSAENTSDGITAPIFYMAFGGAAMGFLYKSVNTLDSMTGYKNDKYIKLGKASARLDDILNFIPSRLTALLMIISCFFTGNDAKNAFRIWKRDRRNHASPNSAQTESAAAGALHVRLAGDAVYFGRLYKKPYIGDDDRSIENEDIRRVNRLMYVSSVMMLILASALRILIFGVLI